MFRRPFFTFLGLGTGVALGAWSVLKFERARQRLRPGNLAAVAGSLGDRLRSALAEGRAAAAAKEAELRGVYRVGEPLDITPPRRPLPAPLRPSAPPPAG